MGLEIDMSKTCIYGCRWKWTY